MPWNIHILKDGVILHLDKCYAIHLMVCERMLWTKQKTKEIFGKLHNSEGSSKRKLCIPIPQKQKPISYAIK